LAQGRRRSLNAMSAADGTQNIHGESIIG
jgi:hypothetical protein